MGPAYDDDRPPRPRVPPFVWAVGIPITLFALVLGAGFLAYSGRVPRPRVAGELAAPGRDWTVKELAEHLRSKGLTVRVVSRGGVAYLVTPAADRWVADGAFDAGSPYPVLRLDGVVAVDRLDSAEGARQAAGRSEGGALAWGRWLFQGEERNLAPYRTALR